MISDLSIQRAVPYRDLSRDTAIKWFLLTIVGLADWIWMASAGFRVSPAYTYALPSILLLICISLFYFYTGREQRIMEFAHFAAQLLALYAVTMPLTFLAVSTNAPLHDNAFDGIDKAMGLDWVAWTQWMTGHPYLRWILAVVYGSLPVQGFFCYIYNVHTREFWRNTELWWATFISLIITIAGSAAFPAMNPYVYYGLESSDRFIHMGQFLGLRDGTMRVVSTQIHEGLVQLPSFHTILAILMTYNVRHNHWLLAFAVVLNAALIISCPTEGSHYFIDLFAGVAVAAVTIWGIRRFLTPQCVN